MKGNKGRAMKKTIFASAIMMVMGWPLMSHALPVEYRLTYDSTVGPNGVGAFLFDHEDGALTDFNWDFGNPAIGGIANSHFAFDVFGDTRGRYLFEVLSRVDEHQGVDCSSAFSDCASGDSINIGTGPLDATNIVFYTRGAATSYEFSRQLDVLASGFVTLSRNTQVPEPGSLALLGISILGLGVLRRRTRTKA
jgi:PEP-CTERM motif